jgi:hypothetical protein
VSNDVYDEDRLQEGCDRYHRLKNDGHFIKKEEKMEFKAYMRDGDNYLDVSDRMSLMEGAIANGVLSFRFVSLEDKMSAREGRLYVTIEDPAVKILPASVGAIMVVSPRRPDRFRTAPGIVVYAIGPEAKPALIFTVESRAMTGSAETSEDIPWSWHYGFDIEGSITVKLEDSEPDPEPGDVSDEAAANALFVLLKWLKQ